MCKEEERKSSQTWTTRPCTTSLPAKLFPERSENVRSILSGCNLNSVKKALSEIKYNKSCWCGCLRCGRWKVHLAEDFGGGVVERVNVEGRRARPRRQVPLTSGNIIHTTFSALISLRQFSIGPNWLQSQLEKVSAACVKQVPVAVAPILGREHLLTKNTAE